MSDTIQNHNSVILNGKRRNVYTIGHGLIPKANVKAYINDVEVTDFVMATDVIQVEYYTANTHIDRWRSEFMNGEKFYINNVAHGHNMLRGHIHYVEKVSYNANTGYGVANVHVFMTDPGTTTSYNTLENGRVFNANTVHLTTSESGRTANNKIIAYYPKFSAVMDATANTVKLEGKFANSNTSLVGQTIYVVSGDGAGQNSNITAYNTTTRVATVSPDFDIIPGAIANTSISVNDRSMVRIGDLYADNHGTVPVVVMLPEIIEHDLIPNTYGYNYWVRWNNWHKRFRYHTRNTIRFENGLSSIGVDDPEDDNTKDANTDSTGGQTTSYSTDPFAQTFIIDDKLHPQGVTVTSIKLLFETKDDDYPVQVEIRPTIAGVPAPASKVKNGIATIQPIDIVTVSQDTIKILNAAGTSPFSSNTYYTKATFKAPVYLEPGKQYAIVIASCSSKHKIYTAVIGDKILGTNRIISNQPYLGVLYKTQNSSRWEPFPNEDLCFELLKATYSTANTATIDFTLKALPTDIDNHSIQGIIDMEGTAPRYNVNVSSIYLSSVGDIKQANTTIDYSIRTTRQDGSQDSFVDIPLYTNHEFNDSYGARVITSNNQSMVVRATLTTNNPDVPPSVDFTALNALVVWHNIDNGSIANSDVLITNAGQDYPDAANVTITISGGGGGTGATANANVVNGAIDAIYITNGGSGYTGSPTVTITSLTSVPTINAQAVIIGEDQPNGGVSPDKYITRKVTLADGFDGGDLRVLFTAYKPTECEIDVYYKVLSQDDADSLDNKRWTLMTKIGGISSNSINNNDLKNYIYAPGTNNLADNKINYDGFTTFKYFAIKLVMRTSDVNIVPRISNFRVIALSELL